MHYPRIKHIHNPMRLNNGRIRIGTVQYGVGAEIEDDEHGSIWQLLALMDGQHTLPEIVAAMQQTQPELDGESVSEVIDSLTTAGFVEDAGAPIPSTLTTTEIEQYNRNTPYFAWVDTQPRTSPYEIQARLKNARVTIVGLGGTGSSMAMSLTAAGVGTIHCVDCDVVELSNLNRQLLYTTADIGFSKVERAVARLQELNPHSAISGQELQITSSSDVASLMHECDLFVLCADKPLHKIQAWTNEAALQTRTPWLMSLYTGPMSVVGLFIPFETPCYHCMLHHEAERKKSDGELLLPGPPDNAVIAPTAGISGHMGALEAIYFLGDMKPQTVGRIFHQNLMIYDHFYYIEAPFWSECPLCGQSDLPHGESTCNRASLTPAY